MWKSLWPHHLMRMHPWVVPVNIGLGGWHGLAVVVPLFDGRGSKIIRLHSLKWMLIPLRILILSKVLITGHIFMGIIISYVVITLWESGLGHGHLFLVAPIKVRLRVWHALRLDRSKLRISAELSVNFLLHDKVGVDHQIIDSGFAWGHRRLNYKPFSQSVWYHFSSRRSCKLRALNHLLDLRIAHLGQGLLLSV